jgi:hypothetical protein
MTTGIPEPARTAPLPGHPSLRTTRSSHVPSSENTRPGHLVSVTCGISAEPF